VTVGESVSCIVMGLLGLFGLLLASRAHDAGFAWFGYALAGFGILNIFVTIHRASGTPRG